MFDLYKDKNRGLPDIAENEMTDQAVIEEIGLIKKRLGDKVVILGHHYQQDDIISFADYTGDSYLLAKRAAALTDRKYVVFCGVHFMAETADMLTGADKMVILPDLSAGCSMADMASRREVEKAWRFLEGSGADDVTPITYINSTADLKAFVGMHGGAICTSSNARKVIEWAFEQNEKVFFFPDQHLGRNTCFEMGIPLTKMVVYNPRLPDGGLTGQDVRNAKVVLWYGYCSVHQGFTKLQIDNLRRDRPQASIIVHPECNFEVFCAADHHGSTAQIITFIDQAASGSEIAVGTEINLVNRVSKQYKDKKIFSLSPYQCLCATMYRVRPRWLLAALQAIEKGAPINVIRVPEQIRDHAQLALDRMLKIS